MDGLDSHREDEQKEGPVGLLVLLVVPQEVEEMKNKYNSVHAAKKSSEVNGTGLFARELGIATIKELDVDFEDGVGSFELVIEVLLAVGEGEVPDVLPDGLRQVAFFLELAVEWDFHGEFDIRLVRPLALIDILEIVPFFVEVDLTAQESRVLVRSIAIEHLGSEDVFGFTNVGSELGKIK